MQEAVQRYKTLREQADTLKEKHAALRKEKAAGDERAAELQAFMTDTRSSVGGFLGRMAKASPNAFGKVFGRKEEAPTRAEGVAAAHEVTHSEREWLDARIDADGRVDEYERALLDFLAEE